MQAVLRLFEDVMAGDAAEVALPAAPRIIFVVHGAVAVDGKSLADGETWHGEGAAKLRAGKAGATCWRWELARTDAEQDVLRDRGMLSHEKLAGVLTTLPKGDLLLRGDSVAFPPGGCAYLHKHQGPGIRCLIEGGIRIDTHGRSTSYAPRLRLIRGGSGAGLRAGGGRPAEPLHPGDDFAGGTDRQKLDPVCQRRRQGQAEVAELQGVRRCADQVPAWKVVTPLPDGCHGSAPVFPASGTHACGSRARARRSSPASAWR